jgi:hypothetical protein
MKFKAQYAFCLLSGVMAALSACTERALEPAYSPGQVSSHAPQSNGKAPAASTNGAVPKIDFDTDRIDIGKVDAAAEVPCKFVIFNRGTAPLQITKAKSECGCTATDFKGCLLKPGSSTPLNIIVDTTLKQGPVTKDMVVYSDDPERPIARLFISMDVKNAHGKMTMAERTKIFTAERCKTCHVDQGVGQFGKELFEADCAMCHRRQESGILSGPPIETTARAMANAKYAAHVRTVISEGSKSSSMPGFLVDNGGPLTAEQIDSLVTYLKKPSK